MAVLAVFFVLARFFVALLYAVKKKKQMNVSVSAMSVLCALQAPLAKGYQCTC